MTGLRSAGPPCSGREALSAERRGADAGRRRSRDRRTARSRWSGAGQRRRLPAGQRLHRNGTVRPGWPARHVGEPGYGWGMYNENLAVADMNGDGFKEIFAPTDTHYITALDRNGNQLGVNPDLRAAHGWSDGRRARRPGRRPRGLRRLRHPAPAELREQRARGGRRGRRRHPGAGGHRRRLQLRHRRSRRRPLPPALHPEARPHALVGQRLRLDGHPDRRAGQRTALRRTTT